MVLENNTIKAARIIRHLYDLKTETWQRDETIVNMEYPNSFAHGAMRYCFPMKKLSQPPSSATNHRFHSYGWSRASNYVAKAYMTTSLSSGDLVLDYLDFAKESVRNDIVLQ